MGLIRAVLSQLGFDPIWISWVLSCVEMVSYSFLVSGVPQGSAKPTRGIQLGTQYLCISSSYVLTYSLLYVTKISRMAP